MCSCSPRRLRSPVSGSCSARWRICSSWRADSIALTAWLAKARSAFSISRVGRRWSAGSSAQMLPSIAPPRSRIGTSSTCWSQAREPLPPTPRSTPPRSVSSIRSAAASRSTRITPSRSTAGSNIRSIALIGTRPSRSSSASLRPTVARGTKSSPSSIDTHTVWKPSASWMPRQTAWSISSKPRPSVSRAVTLSRWSTDARWRSAASACCACSSASAACWETATSRSSRSSDGRRPSFGSSTERIPSSSPATERSGTNIASSGCQAPGSAEATACGT